jgi:hypothetical protein
MASISTGTAAMYFSKLPLILLLQRLFGIKVWFHRTCTGLMIFAAIGFLTAYLWVGVRCSPDLHKPDIMLLLQCVQAAVPTGISRNSISLFVDVVVFVLPLFIISDLKLSLRTKIAVSLVFLTGSL